MGWGTIKRRVPLPSLVLGYSPVKLGLPVQLAMALRVQSWEAEEVPTMEAVRPAWKREMRVG
jgi:hypothetical protein